jgi:hypothetical protein
MGLAATKLAKRKKNSKPDAGVELFDVSGIRVEVWREMLTPQP